jgi:hypothetical protein
MNKSYVEERSFKLLCTAATLMWTVLMVMLVLFMYDKVFPFQLGFRVQNLQGMCVCVSDMDYTFPVLCNHSSH